MALIRTTHRLTEMQMNAVENGYREQVDKNIRSMLCLAIAGLIETMPDIVITKTVGWDTRPTVEYTSEVFVLSLKDVERIGEIIMEFESYAKTYPAMYAVRDKLEEIRDIFLTGGMPNEDAKTESGQADDVH